MREEDALFRHTHSKEKKKGGLEAVLKETEKIGSSSGTFLAK